MCLENTHNRGGGRIQPYETVEAICRWAREHGLATHLDGARLLNAAVATGIEPARWAAHFDTVSVCFSKGLGAPVGSALAGPAELIARAHAAPQGARRRHAPGGRASPPAALYALENHVERLAEDHANARRLAEAIRQIDVLELQPPEADTNLVFFRVDPAWARRPIFRPAQRARRVDRLAFGGQRDPGSDASGRRRCRRRPGRGNSARDGERERAARAQAWRRRMGSANSEVGIRKSESWADEDRGHW